MNPQSWNAYAYVNNNPLNATDPSGMCDSNDSSCFSITKTACSWWQFWCWAGGGAGSDGFTSGGTDNGDDYGWGLNYRRPATSNQQPAPMPTQPPKSGLTPAQLQTILNAAKKDAATCAGTFSAGMSPFGLRFSLKGFDAQIQNTKYLQYPNPAANPLGPLSSVEAQALKGSIALYPNFFTDTSPRQAGIVVHENLHVYTGWSDSNVFSVFQQRGITPNDVTQFMKYGNTDGITTWIVRGCR